MGLALQYNRLDLEDHSFSESNMKHYEAGVEVKFGENSLKGVERLYRTSLVIEPTLICAAHCRYCLRANYSRFTLDENELTKIAQYCGSKDLRDQLKEVLITGGDPLIIPGRLAFLIDALCRHAPGGARLATVRADSFSGAATHAL